MSKQYQYVKVAKERRDYLGEKYFRFNFNEDTVVQVCMNPGSITRRGKSNIIGVYVISKMTLLANYLGMSYVEQCTKEEFDQKFDEVINFLK
jgi:hypothetical protein